MGIPIKDKEAASIIGVSVHALARWRKLNMHLDYVRASNGTLSYDLDQVREFVKMKESMLSNKNYLSLVELAKLLNIGRATLSDWRRLGKLKLAEYKFGKNYYYKLSDVTQYLRNAANESYKKDLSLSERKFMEKVYARYKAKSTV